MNTLLSMFALRGRYRDNPSMRTRATDNYEQRMEIVGGGGLAQSLRFKRTT